MDFFQSQDNARRNTALLVLLFTVAVTVLVAITNVVVAVGLQVFTPGLQRDGHLAFSLPQFLWVSGIVVFLVLLMSWLRIVDLRKGGRRVAERIGASELTEHRGNLQRRRLLNIVEEMAIAAGLPVPPVYLMPDPAINAFAAGYAPGDAVIGITQGALDNLDRAQLQAIVGHEMSHVLNGDMRLNIRLMGMVSGLEFIADYGEALLYTGAPTVSSSGRDRDSVAFLAFRIMGFALLAVGSLGRLAGTLIKAAVSRQREFLADASAVQFTRDNEGLRDALRRIGGFDGGTVLAHPGSHELSHAFFSPAVRFRLAALTSTHPPIEERIRRVDPRWRGSFLRQVPEGQSRPTPEEVALGFADPHGAARTIAPDAALAAAWAPAPEVDDARLAAAAVVGAERAGSVDLAAARSLLATLPPPIVSGVHDAGDARRIAALLIARRPREPAVIEELVRRDAMEQDAAARLAELVARVPATARLPVLELAMPALRRMDGGAYAAFRELVEAVREADGRTTLREWTLQRFLRVHLKEAFAAQPARSRRRRLKELHPQAALLLSLLAHAGERDADRARSCYAAGASELGITLPITARGRMGLKGLDAALDALAELRPLQMPKLLKAMARTVAADGRVDAEEAELLRTIADVLGCPMPPLAAPGRA